MAKGKATEIAQKIQRTDTGGQDGNTPETFEPLTYGDYRNAAKDVLGDRIMPALKALPSDKQGTIEGGVLCCYELLCMGLDLFQNMIGFSRVDTPERDNLFFQKKAIEIHTLTPEYREHYIIKINNPFLLTNIEFMCCCEYLETFFISLKNTKPNEDLYRIWPCAPGAVVFSESGFSVLEAICKFMEKTFLFIQQNLMDRYFGLAGDKRYQSIFDVGEENLPISPKPAKLIKFWTGDCLSHLSELIPTEIYPDVKLFGELDSIRYRLRFEYNAFLKKVNSDEWPTETGPGETDTGKIKKRGRNVLKKQVADLLKRLKWPVDMTLTEIKEILDIENCKKYKPTNVRAIRDTEAWATLQKIKASVEAKD